MNCTITLPSFEGPLDLLLYLVEKQELDIQAINVAPVAEQYLLYLRRMDELDLDLASEFYLMAVRLLSIKARSLLPSHRRGEAAGPESEDAIEDPRQALIRELEAYRLCRAWAQGLSLMAEGQSTRYARPASLLTEQAAAEAQRSKVSQAPPPLALLDAYTAALARQRRLAPRLIPQEALSIRRRMAELLRLLRRTGATLFSALSGAAASRRDIVVTFLALLELMRRRRVRVTQGEPLAELSITLPDRGSLREAAR